jgi:pimeloyl-ACP methyl ester carboxylesterase
MIKEVSFPSADGTLQLYGDLSLPKEEEEKSSLLLPAIVIINGSGPIDRHGNVPQMKLKLNTSNQIAKHMVENRPNDRKTAVLSYDKRGVGKSINKKKKNGDNKNLFYRAGMMDFVLDAVEAVKFVCAHPRIDKDRIVLMGHSEGAIVLSLICSEVNKAGLTPPIFGCIFYAGFGETLEEAMALQRENILADVQAERGIKGFVLRRLITEEKLMKQHKDTMAKVHAEGDPEFISMSCGSVKLPAKWFREHMAFDAKNALKEHIICHCLAITGQKDVQVHNEQCSPEKAAALIPLAISIESHRPVNLTHALRSLDGQRSSILNVKSDYARMGKLPLDQELLSITDDWCDRRLFGSQS